MLHKVKKPASWKRWHWQGQIVFVFEDRIEFEVAAEWLAELLAFWVIFAHLSKVFIDVYKFNCMNLLNLYISTF
jgi:hypothetical protein